MTTSYCFGKLGENSSDIALNIELNQAYYIGLNVLVCCSTVNQHSGVMGLSTKILEKSAQANG